MGQINVNPPPSGGGGDSGTAAVNLLTVVIVLIILAILLWAVFAGPLHPLIFNVNVNVTPVPQQQVVPTALPRVQPTP